MAHRHLLLPRIFCFVVLFTTMSGPVCVFGAEQIVETDLLVVGGTESGCAAVVQAARMGVKKIVLVNDIEWLGGQFSAEGLGAIDENRAHGYNGTVPIPRSGIFREVIDRMEQKNAELYDGVRRPGNTRVITTVRPIVAEEVFRELLAPYEKSGQLVRYSHYQVRSVVTDKQRVLGVKFASTREKPAITVHARMTIDASDWGDVIQQSGARWDAGVDAKSKFHEPSAPVSGEPATDLNPITWCMILEEQKNKTLFPKPANYDPRYFNKTWGWIDEEFAYTSRRLVDGRGFQEITHPDVLLINSPPTDYPLDVYPANVAAALEATEPGASRKSLVAMTPDQREIVFRDARQHTLKYYYHLQQRFPKFRRMALSDEFGTADKLPPKPYVRESLRLVAQHIVKEQEVLGFGSRSHYATTMFPDAVFSWQFELDFHPTRRSWTTDQGDKGPWEADFRGHRRFGRGGTGRCVFPLRSLVPLGVQGLLGAQKNLGYTSIVSSSCRLHDQSIHVGQASGAVAAVCLRYNEDPGTFYLRPKRIAEIQMELLTRKTGVPLVIWPFADLQPDDPGFVAIQQLALRRLLPLNAGDTSFSPDKPVTPIWLKMTLQKIGQAGYKVPLWNQALELKTRREAAVQIWSSLSKQPVPARMSHSETDADGDGLPNPVDPLPFTVGKVSWRLEPHRDGLPELKPPFAENVKAFNFTAANGPKANGFQRDTGARWQKSTGYGWRNDLTGNTRLRGMHRSPLCDGFIFTRKQDVWECEVQNGRWKVHFSIGDAGHPQPGQYVTVEQKPLIENLETGTGSFYEAETEVEVKDGRLTLTIGTPDGGSNTCINWIILQPVE